MAKYDNLLKSIKEASPAKRVPFIPTREELSDAIDKLNYVRSPYQVALEMRDRAYAKSVGWDYHAMSAFEWLHHRRPELRPWMSRDSAEIVDYMNHNPGKSIYQCMLRMTLERTPEVVREVSIAIDKYPDARGRGLEFSQSCYDSLLEEQKRLGQPMSRVVSARIGSVAVSQDVSAAFKWARKSVNDFSLPDSYGNEVANYAHNNSVSMFKAIVRVDQFYRNGQLSELSSKPVRGPQNLTEQMMVEEAKSKMSQKKRDIDWDAVIEEAGILTASENKVFRRGQFRQIKNRKKNQQASPAKEKTPLEKLSNVDFVDLILSEPDEKDQLNTYTKTPTYNVAVDAKNNFYRIDGGAPMRKKMETSVKRSQVLMDKLPTWAEERALVRASEQLEEGALFSRN